MISLVDRIEEVHELNVFGRAERFLLLLMLLWVLLLRFLRREAFSHVFQLRVVVEDSLGRVLTETYVFVKRRRVVPHFNHRRTPASHKLLRHWRACCLVLERGNVRLPFCFPH